MVTNSMDLSKWNSKKISNPKIKVRKGKIEQQNEERTSRRQK
jgi:hypothetical protein